MASRHVRLLRWLAALIALVMAAAVQAGAQGRAQGGEHRAVLVTVLDARGNVVSGLTATNFRGEFRGHPVTVVSSTEDTAPRHVDVVVDVSASEAATVRGQWAEAEQLIDLLAPRESIALFSLNVTLKKYADFTTDKDTLRKAIRGARAAQPSGSSALYDGIAELATTLPDPHPGDAICLFSDGDDTSSRRTQYEASRIVADKNIRVFLMGDVHGPPRDVVKARSDWATIANATGGWTRWIDPERDNPGQIARSNADVAAAITSYYRIEIDLASAVDKTRDWKLQVTDSRGQGLKNVRVFYAHMLVPRSAR